MKKYIVFKNNEKVLEENTLVAVHMKLGTSSVTRFNTRVNTGEAFSLKNGMEKEYYITCVEDGNTVRSETSERAKLKRKNMKEKRSLKPQQLNMTDEEKEERARAKKFEVSEKRKEEIVNQTGEYWKQNQIYSHIWCSNLGRVKMVGTNGNERLLALMGSKNKTGKTYYDVTIPLYPRGFRCRVSRLMANTFLDPKFPIVDSKGAKLIADHIDNNSENNNIENIQILDQSTNLKKNPGKRLDNMKKCFALNFSTGERRVYNSTVELVKDICGKENAGYFHHAVTTTHNLKGWFVDYE